MKKTIILIFLVTVNVIQGIGQTYFNMATEYPVANYNPNPDFNQIGAINNATLVKAFDYISKKSGVEFNYPQGGCPERALILQYLLDSMKIPSFRIWIFAPSRLIQNDIRKIFIYDKNALTTGVDNKIEWSFHVAPCVLSKSLNGNIDTLVVDPSINSQRPLKHTEWLASIGNHEVSSYTFLDGKYYQFNTQNGGASNVINGFFYAYEGGAYNNVWLEKMLALNDVAYTMFKKYVKGKNQSLQEVIDIKEVIGNSATLKEVLDFKNGEPAASKLRYLVSKYPKIATEMWALYSSKLIYWMTRVGKLKK